MQETDTTADLSIASSLKELEAIAVVLNKQDDREWLVVMERIDRMEAEMAKLTQFHIQIPTTHRFTPGLYIREVAMPAGSIVTSRIHSTEHPYVISKGKASVFVPGEGARVLAAPYTGLTKAGTRRLLYIHEDCVWTTFHATEETNVEKIEEEIFIAHSDHIKKKESPCQE